MDNLDYPEVIVIDLDGTLTDGTLTIDHNGEKMFKQFHTRDVRAIRELVNHGIEIYIVSADGWGGANHFAEKVGAVFFECRDKSEVVKALAGRKYWAVGDDAWDIAMMKGADICFCPQDADYSVFNMNPGCNLRILNRQGGRGVMAEIVWLLFENPDRVAK